MRHMGLRGGVMASADALARPDDPLYGKASLYAEEEGEEANGQPHISIPGRKERGREEK